MSRSARGFAMSTVIIILLIVVVFGTALASIVATQQTSVALDIEASKAYQAARAGVELGLYESIVNGTAGCAGANATVVLGGALAGFRVTVTCASTPHVEGAPPAVNMFEIAATGCNAAAGNCPGAPSASYVERQLRVTAGSN